MLNLNFTEKVDGSKAFKVRFTFRGVKSVLVVRASDFEGARKAFYSFKDKVFRYGKGVSLTEIEEIGYGPVVGPLFSEESRNRAA